MSRVVVLLGPPGSGKSTIGEALAAEGLRWRDWEAELLASWGTRERFVEVKDVALPALHRDIRAWIESSDQPAVLETTGLSDADLVRSIVATGDALLVRLDVGEDAAIERISRRGRGRHLTDEEAPNRRVWQAFHDVVPRSFAADLVVDTEACTPTETAQLVIDLLAG